MPEIKKSSKPHVPIVFLKWLVIVLSVVMIIGFLFIITILGIKIANFNKTPQPTAKSSNSDVIITRGKVESININDDQLTIVVKVSEGHLEVSVVDIKDGILLNQFFIEQKKKPYNE